MSLFSKIKNESKSAPAQEADCDFSPLFPLELCDFHSHILPQMDDGSTDEKESVSMLAEMKKQGIQRVLATSHFYPEREAPADYLARRRKAIESLCTVWTPDLPAVIPAAEVAYYEGIGCSSDISSCCVAGTRCILVEMPFERWSKQVVTDVLEMRDRLGLYPIIAHIERYAMWQKKDTIAELRSHDILIQSNAAFFYDSKTAEQALAMLDAGLISVLGSDAHNMTTRPPDLGKGTLAIAKAFGEEPLAEMASLEAMILYKAQTMETVL